MFAQANSEGQQTSQTHSCSYNIDRIQAGPPDYQAILMGGKKFVDTTFPRNNEAIYWSDRRPDNAQQSLIEASKKVQFWQRLSERYPQNMMFGQGGLTIFDTAQSQSLGNCYFIAGMIAFAEEEKRFREMFVIQEINEIGIYAFNMYIRGKPTIVVIDDYIPFI